MGDSLWRLTIGDSLWETHYGRLTMGDSLWETHYGDSLWETHIEVPTGTQTRLNCGYLSFVLVP